MTKSSALGLVLLGMMVEVVAFGQVPAGSGKEGVVHWHLLPKVHITEICVAPPPGKNWPAWVELWNNGVTNIDIRGYSLSTLQETYKPFPGKTVLQPNARLVVLFYTGDLKDDDFESRIPSGVPRIRMFGVAVFPPYKSHQQWVALGTNSMVEDLQKEKEFVALAPVEREAKINSVIASYVESTRFVNELAFRTPDGDLVGYVAWGDKRGIDRKASKEYKPTVAREEALKKGLVADYLVPRRFADRDWGSAAVLQLAPIVISGDPETVAPFLVGLSGVYQPLVRPEVNCSPGTPLHLDVKAPELLPVGPCAVGWTQSGPCVSLKIPYKEGITDPVFERVLGWSSVVFDICYDHDMKKSVFRTDVNTFIVPHQNCLRLPLTPSDYQQLAGKTLYFRASKHHKQEGTLYSNIQEAKIVHDGRDAIPTGASNTNHTAGMLELAHDDSSEGSTGGQVGSSVEQKGASAETTDSWESERLP